MAGFIHRLLFTLKRFGETTAAALSFLLLMLKTKVFILDPFES